MNALLERNIIQIIPSKLNENRADRLVEFDEASYGRRGIVEQVIGWRQEWRRMATRYEKRATHYLPMVKLAMIGRYLRRIAPQVSQA